MLCEGDTHIAHPAISIARLILSICPGLTLEFTGEKMRFAWAVESKSTIA